MARFLNPRRSWTNIRATIFTGLAMFSLSAHAMASDLINVALKPEVRVDSADVRIGDIFSGAGDAGLALFGPAPSPGRTMSYAAGYVQAKAKQVGLNWTNAEGVDTINISRGGSVGGATASRAVDTDFPERTANGQSPDTKTAQATADLKRGDSVMIVYRAPGIELLARGKATADASIGGKARATILGSNKPVDGTLVSPGHIEAYSRDTSALTQVASNSGNF